MQLTVNKMRRQLAKCRRDIRSAGVRKMLRLLHGGGGSGLRCGAAGRNWRHLRRRWLHLSCLLQRLLLNRRVGGRRHHARLLLLEQKLGQHDALFHRQAVLLDVLVGHELVQQLFHLILAARERLLADSRHVLLLQLLLQCILEMTSVHDLLLLLQYRL